MMQEKVTIFKEYNNGSLQYRKNIIKHIADNLSEQNKAEARLLYKEHVSFYDILMEQAGNTETGFVLFDPEGNPHGIGGIQRDRSVWLVVTEQHTKYMCVGWLKAGHRWFAKQLERYRVIYGYCWSENKLSMQWMRWLGFDFAALDSAATFTMGTEKFIYFQKTK